MVRWELTSNNLQYFFTVRWTKDTALIWVSDFFVNFISPLKLYKYQYPFAWVQNGISYGRVKNIRFLLGGHLQALTEFVHVAAAGLYALKGVMGQGEMVCTQTGYLHEMFMTPELPLMCLWTYRFSFACWWKCEFGESSFIINEVAIGKNRTIGTMGLRRGAGWWGNQEMWTYDKKKYKRKWGSQLKAKTIVVH